MAIRGAQRNILIGAAALVVVAIAITAFARGTDVVSGLFGSRNKTPIVMIVTQTILESRIDATARDVAITQEVVRAAPATKVAAPATSAAPPQPTAKTEAAAQQNRNMSLVLKSLQDPLAGSLANALESSGRFKVVANPVVADAMEDFGFTREAKAEDNPQSAPGKFMSGLTNFKNGKTERNQKKNIEQNSASQLANDPTGQGLTKIAKKVRADYVLIVTMPVPNFSIQGVEPDRVNLVSQPIINYEIYDVRSRFSYRGSKQLDKPLVESMRYIDGGFRPGPLESLQKLTMRLSQAATAYVLENALKQIAPARITRAGEQIVINRGANDGVRLGAIYNVEREIGDVVAEGSDSHGKGGRALERIRTSVGQIRIDRVQDRIAVGSVVSGGPFAKDDVVIFAAGIPGANPTQGGLSTQGVPLGSQALSQADLAKSGVPLRKASVAINRIMLNGADSVSLSKSLATALQKDRRITVLSRKDHSDVVAERQFAEEATGEYGASPLEGMQTADIVIVGEFSSSTSRKSNTVSVGGVSRVVGSSSSTRTTGVLRAMSVSGALLESVEVSIAGGSAETAADAAAQALLLKLFPIKVVQVDAGGGLIRLSRGEDAGLRVGGRMKIYSTGEKIVDPQTGVLLSDGARTYVGDIVLTDVEPGISTGRFAGEAFTVAVGYSAQPGSGSAAPAPGGSAGTGSPRASKPAAKPRPAARPEPEVRW